jgi:hypothetical protein
MKLSDAELQQTTGFPIVKGRLSIGSKADMTVLAIPDHDRLLLAVQNLGGGLAVWPATNVTRDESGFSNAAPSQYGLVFHGFTAQDIGHLSSPGGDQSFVRGGISAGNLIKFERFVPGRPDCIDKPLTLIRAYELTAEDRLEGLHFAISGQFAAATSAPLQAN